MSVEGSLSWRPPYRPSWANRLIGWIARLPVPAWIFYLASWAALVLGVGAVGWISGSQPLGEFDRVLLVITIYPIWGLAALHYLNGVMGTAMEKARPGLTVDEDAYRRLRWEATTIPARVGLAILLVVTPLSAMSAVWVRSLPGVEPGGAAILVATMVISAAGYVLTTMLIFNGVRQLRVIGHIQQVAHLDLFNPGPLYGFADVTARTGLGLLLGGVVGYLLLPDLVAAALPVYLPFAGAMVCIAAAIFVVPLWGIHGRLLAEKVRLQGEATDGFKAVAGEIHDAIDRHDLPASDALNKMLLSVSHERDVIARLPTWPWSPGTLRGFISAMLIPIGLWVITRLLGEVVLPD